MTASKEPASSDHGLDVHHLTVRFGGVTAVDDLSFSAPTGRLTGLIGPNGAGKSTTFNACSGLVRPSSGTVSLGGHDITKMSPPQRARLGLGRTFQRIDLFDRLSVGENVAMGAEAGLVGRRRLGSLFATRLEASTVAAAAMEATERCGITDLATESAGTLSTGQRRLVELARAIAGGFQILLLDEPSSGLDSRETGRFASILRQVVDEHGTGVLLVEHDMSLVREVCDYTYALDFGRLITDGETDEVLASDAVRSIYLGSEVA